MADGTLQIETTLAITRALNESTNKVEEKLSGMSSFFENISTTISDLFGDSSDSPPDAMLKTSESLKANFKDVNKNTSSTQQNLVKASVAQTKLTQSAQKTQLSASNIQAAGISNLKNLEKQDTAVSSMARNFGNSATFSSKVGSSIKEWGPTILMVAATFAGGGLLAGAGRFLGPLMKGFGRFAPRISAFFGSTLGFLGGAKDMMGGIKDMAVSLLTTAFIPIQKTLELSAAAGKKLFEGVQYLAKLGVKGLLFPLKATQETFDFVLKNGNEFRNEMKQIEQTIEDTKDTFSTTQTTSLFNNADKFFSMRRSFMEEESAYVRRFGQDLSGINNMIKTGVKHVSDMGVFSEVIGKEILKVDDNLPKRVYALDKVVSGLGLSSDMIEFYAQKSVMNRKGIITTLVDLKDVLQDVSEVSDVDLKRLSKNFQVLRKDIINFGHISDKELAQTTAKMMQLGLTTESVSGIFGKFNTFEDAAKSAAMLSQAFGMNIDALKMIKAENPMEIIDMFSESLAATGRSFNQMNRHEKKLLQTYTGLSAKSLKSVMNYKQLGMTQEEAMAKLNEDPIDKQIESLESLTGVVKELVTVLSFDSGKSALLKGLNEGLKMSSKKGGPLDETSKLLRDMYYNVAGQDMKPVTMTLSKLIDPLLDAAKSDIKGMSDVVSKQLNPLLQTITMNKEERINLLARMEASQRTSGNDDKANQLKLLQSNKYAVERNEFFIKHAEGQMKALIEKSPVDTLKKAYGQGAKITTALARLSTSAVGGLTDLYSDKIDELNKALAQGGTLNEKLMSYKEEIKAAFGIDDSEFETTIKSLGTKIETAAANSSPIAQMIADGVKEGFKSGIDSVKDQWSDKSSTFNLKIMPAVGPMLEKLSDGLIGIFKKLLVMIDDSTGLITKYAGDLGKREEWTKMRESVKGKEKLEGGLIAKDVRGKLKIPEFKKEDYTREFKENMIGQITHAGKFQQDTSSIITALKERAEKYEKEEKAAHAAFAAVVKAYDFGTKDTSSSEYKEKLKMLKERHNLLLGKESFYSKQKKKTEELLKKVEDQRVNIISAAADDKSIYTLNQTVAKFYENTQKAFEAIDKDKFNEQKALKLAQRGGAKKAEIISNLRKVYTESAKKHAEFNAEEAQYFEGLGPNQKEAIDMHRVYQKQYENYLDKRRKYLDAVKATDEGYDRNLHSYDTLGADVFGKREDENTKLGKLFYAQYDALEGMEEQLESYSGFTRHFAQKAIELINAPLDLFHTPIHLGSEFSSNSGDDYEKLTRIQAASEAEVASILKSNLNDVALGNELYTINLKKQIANKVAEQAKKIMSPENLDKLYEESNGDETRFNNALARQVYRQIGLRVKGITDQLSSSEGASYQFLEDQGLYQNVTGAGDKVKVKINPTDLLPKELLNIMMSGNYNVAKQAQSQQAQANVPKKVILQVGAKDFDAHLVGTVNDSNSNPRTNYRPTAGSQVSIAGAPVTPISVASTSPN